MRNSQGYWTPDILPSTWEKNKIIIFLFLVRVLWKNLHLTPSKHPGPVEDVSAMGLELGDLQSSLPIQTISGF